MLRYIGITGTDQWLTDLRLDLTKRFRQSLCVLRRWIIVFTSPSHVKSAPTIRPRNINIHPLPGPLPAMRSFKDLVCTCLSFQKCAGSTKSKSACRVRFSYQRVAQVTQHHQYRLVQCTICYRMYWKVTSIE